ncbi:Flavin-dependent monooxygenase, oxygenase subunit HsaA [Streptomyces sp. YIM 130001]|uniref:acyl-CoA dehydrogenase family protein n=1 Tax=Streptomyces sp. YIM 130001 TaxID=2259644 RepID=UPI000E6531FC|nr:acyl-CoA dehydrogenase family protein [Streptomyces sp. YIM 130001]RII07933.1 Flavin-dependent monooxygenase, oxygenase subunit HsaA [Streptomyces sp. YIM 130001]
MADAAPPSRQELVARAKDLAPLLSKHALWAEENRRLHDEVVEAMTDAGIFRMRVPVRYGGYESDTRTVSEVLAELARGDGSAGWTAAVWSISTWIAGFFPDPVQDEIFAAPGTRVCGILSPTALAVPVEGGVLVNGTWSFNSGALHSKWNMNAALLERPDGGKEPVMLALPMSDLEIVDDWHVAGLCGSGSVSTTARDVFVPQQRVLSMGPVLQERYSSESNAGSAIFRGPLLPTACATVTGMALGLAWAGRDAFFERLPGRGIAYTDYSSRREAPLTHLQTADAAMRVDEAEFHAFRAADLIDEKNTSGREWTVEERARVRVDMGRVCQLVKEAVDIYTTAGGASAMYSDVPVQRIERDVQAVNLHAIMHPHTNLELYGRILCDLAPNTHYL